MTILRITQITLRDWNPFYQDVSPNAGLFSFRDSILEKVDNVLMIIAFLQLPEVFSCLEKFSLIKYCFFVSKIFWQHCPIYVYETNFHSSIYLSLKDSKLGFGLFFSNEQTNKVEY